MALADPELVAIRRATKAVEALNADAQARVLNYVLQRVNTVRDARFESAAKQAAYFPHVGGYIANAAANSGSTNG